MTVLLQPTGLKLTDGGSLIYDEAAELLLQVIDSSILLYSLTQPQQAPREVKVSEGPAVAAAKVSLDGRMMALQRSAGHLQFMDLSSTKTFVQGAWKGKSALLGFFWTSMPECSFVMVTKAGLEMYQLQPNKQGLRLVSQYTHGIGWWQYSHAARVLLLGAGNWIQAYQFTLEGIIRLPPFQELSGSPSATASAPSATAGLDLDAVSVLTLYSKVYCAVLDRAGRRLLLHRFYKDAVVLQHQYELPSASVQLAVSDDLLTVHHTRSGQALVIDICAESPPSSRVDIAFASSPAGQSAGNGADEWTRLKRLRFELPNVIIDPSTQEVLESRVDAGAVARNSTDWPAAIGFLLRRNSALYSVDLPQLALSLMKEAIVERSSMETVRRVCGAINAHQAPTSTGRRGQPAKKVTLTPQEVCKEVFAWMHDEEAVDAQYLQAAIVEYRTSACAYGVELPLMQQILAFDVALQLGHGDQVAAEVAWGHDKDCKELASRLEAWAQLPSAAALADGMRSRCDEHEQRCKALLRQGKVMDAVRVIQQNRLKHLLTPELLDVASKQGDVATLAAIYRVCSPQLPAQQPEFRALLDKIQRTAVAS